MNEVLESILLTGGNLQYGKYDVIRAFYLPEKEQISAVMDAFGTGGYGIIWKGQEYAAWWDKNGFMIAPGRTAKGMFSQKYSWEEITEKIRSMIAEHRYVTQEESEKSYHYFFSYAAERLFYLDRDTHFLSTKEVEKNLYDPEFVRNILADLDKMDGRNRRRAMDVKRHIYPLCYIHEPITVDKDFTYEVPEPFITEEEIIRFMISGSGFSQGKYRIYVYYKNDPKDAANFLKNEYGTGGRSHALSGGFHTWEDHDSNGIKLKKGHVEILIRWPEAAKRIQALIDAEEYLSQDELDKMGEYEKSVLAREILHFFSRIPVTVQRPWKSSWFGDQQEEVEELLTKRPEKLYELLSGIYNTEKELQTDSRKKTLKNLRDFMDGTYHLIPVEKTKEENLTGEQMSIFDLI